MNLPEFVNLVAKMRAAQKAYYKKPLSGALIASKVIEKEVDLEIDRQRGQLELALTTDETPVEIPY